MSLSFPTCHLGLFTLHIVSEEARFCEVDAGTIAGGKRDGAPWMNTVVGAITIEGSGHLTDRRHLRQQLNRILCYCKLYSFDLPRSDSKISLGWDSD